MTATTSPRTPAPLPLTRGRRVALLIGVPVCLALIADAGFSLVAPFAEGSYPVSYAAPASTRSLTVTSSGGQLSVRPAPAGRATLAGTARYSFIRSTLSGRTAGDHTTVNYHCAPLPSGDCGLDATVSVPATLPVTAVTGGGNAAVTGISAPVTLSTGGGSLSASHITGRLNLNTNGGNIQATAISAPAFTATTGGGEITASGVSAPTVTISARGGNIQVTIVRSASVTASTGGGNIDIVFAEVPGDVRVNTSGGNITLVLPSGATRYHVAASTAGGNVTDELPRDLSSLHRITATSGGGNITLSQR